MNNKKVIADSPSPKIENKPVKKLSGSFHVDENATKKKKWEKTTGRGTTFPNNKPKTEKKKSTPDPANQYPQRTSSKQSKAVSMGTINWAF